jgi:probable rRNA maturation factor
MPPASDPERESPVIDVMVEDPAWDAAEPAAPALAEIAAKAVLAHERSPERPIAILLTGDERVATLNLTFRGKPAATNVLSFPAAAGSQALGDIALAFGVCAHEAAEQGKSLAHHLQHLTAHGVLHLLGYDHESDAEAETMEAKERAILAGLGVPDPYARQAP